MGELFHRRGLISLLFAALTCVSLEASVFDCGTVWKSLTLQSNYVGEEKNGVRHLNAKQREAYEVEIIDGKFVEARTKLPIHSRWRWNDWLSFRLWFNSGLNWVFEMRRDRPVSILVLSEDGKLYVASPQKDRFHHSSFMAGQPVLFAGGIRFVNGQLVALDNVSGHYRPGSEPLKKFMTWLHDQGVDLGGVRWASQDGRYTDEMPSWAAELMTRPSRPAR